MPIDAIIATRAIHNFLWYDAFGMMRKYSQATFTGFQFIKQTCLGVALEPVRGIRRIIFNVNRIWLCATDIPKSSLTFEIKSQRSFICY